MNRVLFKSNNDHWTTPTKVYEELNKEFEFNDDPCPLYATTDGLARPWGSSTFCNPPYSQIKVWVAKAANEAAMGKTVVLLIPSRTDTKWWHEYVMKASEIRFLKGRLKFGGAANNAPFPSCVVVWRPNERLI